MAMKCVAGRVEEDTFCMETKSEEHAKRATRKQRRKSTTQRCKRNKKAKLEDWTKKAERKQSQKSTPRG